MNIESPNVYIFCAASELFSETLSLAQNEGRLGCVMIINPIEFAETIARDFGIKVIDQNRCQYISKFANRFHGQSSSPANMFEKEPFRTIFLKPPEFWKQNEYRIVWEPTKVRDIEPILSPAPNVVPLLIEVDITGLRDYRQGVTPGLQVIIHKKSGVPGHIDIFDPKEVFSPVIFNNNSNGKLSLAFCSESRPLSYEIRNNSGNECDVIPDNELGLLLACNSLENIKKIELKELL